MIQARKPIREITLILLNNRQTPLEGRTWSTHGIMPLSPPDSLKNDLLTLFAEGDRPPTPARSPRTGERKHDSGLKLLVEGERGWDYMCNEDMSY